MNGAALPWVLVSEEVTFGGTRTASVTCEHGQLQAAFLETSSDGLCVSGGGDDKF